MKRGQQESTTENLQAVLDHLLRENPVYYKDKVESKRDRKSYKYEQLYNLVHNLTKVRLSPAVPSSKLPS